MEIRILAEAGVPLARIRDLLIADPDEFTAAVADIDRDLGERAEAIRRNRQRLGQLTAGDGLFVSAEVAGYLDRLHDLGVSRRAIDMERDGWILMHSASPDQASAWIADKLTAIDDPAFTAIYLEYDAAYDWPPDDPRLPALAERTQRWLATRSTRSTDGPPKAMDATILALAATLTRPSSPAWDRLTELQQHHSDQRGSQQHQR